MGIFSKHPVITTILLFFLSVQLIVFRIDDKSKGLFAKIVLTLNYYPSKLVSIPAKGIVGLWYDYVYLVGVKDENDDLKRETKRLLRDNVKLMEAKLENERLRDLLLFKSRISYPLLSANVIASSPSITRPEVVVIDRGKDDGVVEGMPVATASGVVGRVLVVAHASSEVMLITDELSAVDAYVLRTRARGVVKGSAKGCVMHYLSDPSDVVESDMILSSGRDGFFPKGLIIGIVDKVDVEGGEVRAYLTTKTDLRNVEEVVVILKYPDYKIRNE